MKAVKDVSLKQEMSYSCAENVTQLSRARDGLSIVQECRGKKKNNVDCPTKTLEV